MPRLEKFRHGDVVQIAKNLRPSMAHFTSGVRGIVIGSYRDQYGGSGDYAIKDYTIFVEGQGETSWYSEDQLTFIEHNPSLLDTWEDQIEARNRDESDLKWIREHWSELRDKCPSTSMLAIFSAMEFQSAFLRNGEYYCLFEDWYRMFPIVDFLMTCPSLDALRAAQKKDAPKDTVEVAESFWKKIHE